MAEVPGAIFTWVEVSTKYYARVVALLTGTKI